MANVIINVNLDSLISKLEINSSGEVLNQEAYDKNIMKLKNDITQAIYTGLNDGIKSVDSDTEGISA